jgi:hypothetical protein
VVLLVRREAVLRELAYIRRELDDRRSRVRLIFDQATLAIRFQVVAGGDSTSAPIGVEVVDGGPGLEPASFADDVNVESLLSLFLAMKSELVEFRRFPMDEHNGPKSMAGFRTIDDFLLDPDGKVVRGSGAIPDPANGVFQCKVMRFTPSQV